MCLPNYFPYSNISSNKLFIKRFFGTMFKKISLYVREKRFHFRTHNIYKSYRKTLFKKLLQYISCEGFVLVFSMVDFRVVLIFILLKATYRCLSSTVFCEQRPPEKRIQLTTCLLNSIMCDTKYMNKNYTTLIITS